MKMSNRNGGIKAPVSTRRNVLGAAAGAAAATLAGSPRATNSATIQAGPMPADQYIPAPEAVAMEQSFHLNFACDDNAATIAKRLGDTLKKLGHTYGTDYLGALSQTIANGDTGETRNTDDRLSVYWRRHDDQHLVVNVRLNMRSQIADLPSSWLRGLFG
jgi:hypothetical protein